MNVCNLNYNQQLQLIVCVEHDIYVVFKFLKAHLQTLHEIKEKALRAILIEVCSLRVRDSRQINVSIDNSFIFYLSIDIAYRCEYIACNKERSALNKHKRAMKKHLSKKHNIEHAKEKTQFTLNNVQTICVQSFCTSDNYRALCRRREKRSQRYIVDFLRRSLVIARNDLLACNQRSFRFNANEVRAKIRAQSTRLRSNLWKISIHYQFLRESNFFLTTNHWHQSMNERVAYEQEKITRAIACEHKRWIESIQCAINEDLIDCMQQMLLSKRYISWSIKRCFITWLLCVKESRLKSTLNLSTKSSLVYSISLKRIARNQKSFWTFKRITLWLDMSRHEVTSFDFFWDC